MKQIIHRCTRFVKYLFILSLLLLLPSCGEKEDPLLAGYKSSMLGYSEEAARLCVSLDAIDPAASDAVPTLLSTLDSLNESLRGMAALSVPEGYEEAGRLAVEASTLMSDAVSLYHEVYEAESYDDTKAEQARTQYENAMQKLDSLGTFLSGEKK